jgi:hypothetical protein
METNSFDINEIILQRRYADAEPDMLTLRCQSILEEPAAYSCRTGADGSISRSLMKSHSLSVRGITPEDFNTLDAIEWVPTNLSYTILQTGNPKEVRIRDHRREPGMILRFEVDQ